MVFRPPQELREEDQDLSHYLFPLHSSLHYSQSAAGEAVSSQTETLKTAAIVMSTTSRQAHGHGQVKAKTSYISSTTSMWVLLIASVDDDVWVAFLDNDEQLHRRTVIIHGPTVFAPTAPSKKAEELRSLQASEESR